MQISIYVGLGSTLNINLTAVSTSTVVSTLATLILYKKVLHYMNSQTLEEY